MYFGSWGAFFFLNYDLLAESRDSRSSDHWMQQSLFPAFKFLTEYVCCRETPCVTSKCQARVPKCLLSWITSLIFFFFWQIVWWSWSCKYSTPGFLRQVLVTGLIYHSKSKCCLKASSRNESNHKRGQALLTKQDAGFLKGCKRRFELSSRFHWFSCKIT